MELSPKAHAVLAHLVKAGLEERVWESDLAQYLGCDPGVWSKAIDELESFEGGKLVKVERLTGGRRVAATAAAWQLIEPDLLHNDMKAVARYVSEHKRVSYDNLARKTELPEHRMTIAVLNLESEGAVRLGPPYMGRRFECVEATSRLEEWLRKQKGHQ